MRFRLDHPSAPGVVAYGFEPILGWWAECVGPGRPCGCYDRLTPGCGYQEAGCAVLELLHWLANPAQGFFTIDELQEVLVQMQDGVPVPRSLRRAEEVVINLKHAADEG